MAIEAGQHLLHYRLVEKIGETAAGREVVPFAANIHALPVSGPW